MIQISPILCSVIKIDQIDHMHHKHSIYSNQGLVAIIMMVVQTEGVPNKVMSDKQLIGYKGY